MDRALTSLAAPVTSQWLLGPWGGSTATSQAREVLARLTPTFTRVLAPEAKNNSDPRNEEDYDTWEYGTEPIPGDHTWTESENGVVTRN